MTNRTVHLVDDDDALREALTERLEGTGLTVRAYDRASAFLDAMDRVAPGEVVLSDVFMPGMTGLEMLDALSAAGSCAPVVFMTGFGDVPLAVDAMTRGAVTLLEKPVSAAALDQALGAAFEAAAAGVPVSGLDALSDRERAVLAGGARGDPVKLTAAAMGVSPKTVENHRANVRAKLGAASFKEAVETYRAARPDWDAPATSRPATGGGT